MIIILLLVIVYDIDINIDINIDVEININIDIDFDNDSKLNIDKNAHTNNRAVRPWIVGRYAPLGFQKYLKPRNTLYTLPSEPQPDRKRI